MRDRIVDLITARARSSPNAIALHHRGITISYRELESRANKVATILRLLGAGLGATVGLLMNHSPELAVAALGILKTGSAYVPMDPELASEHLTFIARDADVPIVLTQDAVAGRIPFGPWKLISLDGHGPEIERQSDEFPSVPLEDSDAAYVIYRSFAGESDPSRIEHGSLADLASWCSDAFDLTPADRVNQVSRLASDAFACELWPALAAGASVQFSDTNPGLDIEALRASLRANRITIGFAPADMAEFLFTAPCAETSARWVVTSGSVRGNSEVLERFDPAANGGSRKTRLGVFDAGVRLLREGHTGELFIAGVNCSDNSPQA